MSVKIRLVAAIGDVEAIDVIEMADDRWAKMDEDEQYEYLSTALADHVNDNVDTYFEVEESDGDGGFDFGYSNSLSYDIDPELAEDAA